MAASILKIENNSVTFLPEFTFIRDICPTCYLKGFGCLGLDMITARGVMDLNHPTITLALEKNGTTDCGILPIIRELNK